MTLNNPTLFVSTVLIWGTTWYVILGQLGTVHPVVSVGWRFLAAGSILLGICLARGISLRLPLAVHGLALLQGLTLFGINYCLFYTASLTLTTGLISVIFSTMVFWNALGAHWVLGKPLETSVLIGGGIAISGLALLFLTEIEALAWTDQTVVALSLCVCATLCASAGNLISAKTQGAGYSLWPTTGLGMLYGSIMVLTGARVAGIPWDFDLSWLYVGSFLYLVLLGSVAGFAAYLTLLGRVGPGRVAYATVAFPVVAMGLSVLFENAALDHWTALAVVLVLLGNWVGLTRHHRNTLA